MEKSLKTVQTFAKIAKVVALILFILICIGAFFVLISALLVGSFSSVLDTVIYNIEDYIDVGRYNPELIEQVQPFFENGLISKFLYAVLAIAFLSLTVCGVITMMAYVAFKREVNDGTPFTFRFAKDLNRLGWVKLSLKIGLALFIGIASAIIFPSNSFKVTFEISGIIYIIIAAICKYGAYVAEQKKEETALPVEPTEPAETEIPESTETTEE